MGKENKNVLIAYLPSRSDLKIAIEKKWYRIPIDTLMLPDSVRDNSLKLIAFYQPKVFGADAFQIRYYGIVKKIELSKRKSLFKTEPISEKSEREYYKISFDKLLGMPKAIISQRRRRILFISTNLDRFQNASEINDLYYESPIEEKIWKELKLHQISAERQYLETIGINNFYLDFALFCKNRKLAIECDGDKYHDSSIAVHKDKKRDNRLESKGWNILRYTTSDIKYDIDNTIIEIKETINNYGGLENPDDMTSYKYFPKSSQESSLFD